MYLKKICLSMYIYLYTMYQKIWYILMKIFGPIYIIHFYNNDKFINITWNYYLSYFYKRFSFGSYFCKVYHPDRIAQFSYTGKICGIRNIKLPVFPPTLKRKNIMLYENNKPKEINLNILDNYVANTHFISKEKNEIELDTVTKITIDKILQLLNLSCTHVQIITLNPFSKIIKPINETVIGDLYYL
jgi:hypothetical protein